MGSPVLPIIANLYVEEVESRALTSSQEPLPATYRHVDDTWIKTKTLEVEAFTEHMNTVDKSIKFPREEEVWP